VTSDLSAPGKRQFKKSIVRDLENLRILMNK